MTGPAREEVLLELLAVASHDLSNPLQSLAVLLELAIDDLPPDGPAVEKLAQSVSAAEQLRDLVRGLAAFARCASPRGRGARLGDMLGASLGVCRRRLERQAITLSRDTTNIDGIEVDPDHGVATALLAALLGTLRAAQGSGGPAFELHLRGREGPPVILELELRATGERSREDSGALHIGEADLLRCRGSLAASPITVAREGDSGLRFELELRHSPTKVGAGLR